MPETIEDVADARDDSSLTDPELGGVLVTAAGRMAASMRLQGLTVDRKTSISDVVSDADKAAEAMIVRRLAVARPADGIIGEEGAAAPGRRTWVIDPVDGTYNFVSGLPAWLVWAFLYLVQFESRVFVFMKWAIQALTFNRSARLITSAAATDFDFSAVNAASVPDVRPTAEARR